MAGGYIVSEVEDRVPWGAVGRFIGGACGLAGLVLLAAPVGPDFLLRAAIGIAVFLTGALIIARAGRAGRQEIEVDLARGVLRKRRAAGGGQVPLVAQWRFEEITGLELRGQGARAVLEVEAGPGRRRDLIRGERAALEALARRLGGDLLRARQAVLR